MNKALMVAIRSNWLEMILNGKKKYEFRDWKVDKGTVIYFYCTKAKPEIYKDEIWKTNLLNGKVVARGVVKRAYEIERVIRYGKYLSFINQGYTKQRYAIELEQVEAIEPREITSFVSYKKADRVKHIAESFEELIDRENRLSTNIRLIHAPQSRVWVLEEETNEKIY